MRALLFLAALVLTTELSSANYTVQTSNGPITGHPAPGVDSVREFLGIPYARPPVGNLRFLPPERHAKKEPFIASNFSDDCLFTASEPVDFPNETPQFKQIVANFTSYNDNEQSEDCLSLNIWSSSGSKNAPIIVFFYGGRFTTGGTNTPLLNGKYFADAQYVVVVTVNYRTNIFGFPGAPGEPQNLGLLDQRLAVEWVRDNAWAFGGDPDRIAISGQSSGSLSVDFWSYAWTEEPIVSGLISHSGTVFSFEINTQELALRHWYNASSLLGCGSSGDVMPCMRSKSAEEIKAAITEIPPPPNSSVARSPPVFQPIPDNVVVFEDYVTLSDEGQFVPIPYLLGHNDNEAGFYNISAFAKGNLLTDAQWAEFNRDVFSCPTRQEATNRANYGAPVWRYRYYADWDNTRLYPTSGAYHGVDLHMIFGASNDVSGLPETQEQIQLKETMQAAWATFAANPEEGLNKEFGWPIFDPNEKTLIQLGFNNDPDVSFISPDVYDDDC